MKKMMLSLLAAMCMLGLTACGNTDSSSSSAAETSAQTQSGLQETQAQQSAEVTEAEQSDEEKAVPGQTEEQSQNADTDASAGADTIVVYFSATGTTKGVAERIASVTNADIFDFRIFKSETSGNIFPVCAFARLPRKNIKTGIGFAF